MSDWIDLEALWKIIVVGLLAGAGLPALFAVGIRALSMPGGGRSPAATTTDGHTVGGGALGIAIAVVCFTIVLAAVAMGIYTIVAD
jgi:hypothetical protein